MSTLKFLILLSAFLTLFGCSPFNINTDYAPNFSVDNWKQYRWQLADLNPQDPYDNDLSRQRVVNAINEELSQQGFQLSDDPEEADFYVDYFFLVEPKVQVRQLNNHRCSWVGCRYDSYDTYAKEYKYGSIVVNISDATTQQLQWRGVAGSRISEGATPEKRKANIQAAMNELFKQFPPTKTSAP